MPRLPDLAGYSFDELQTLVSKANKRLDEIRSKRIKELEAELTKLGANGSASVSGRARGASQRGSESTGGPRRATNAGKSVPAQFRGPNGEEYSGRGAIPRWARDLGVEDRAGLEQFRIQ